MDNLVLNIDFKQQANKQGAQSTKNRDKYKRNKQKIIDKQVHRFEKKQGALPQVDLNTTKQPEE